MQVFLQIVVFSLQTDGSGRPVLKKGSKVPLVVRGSLHRVYVKRKTWKRERSACHNRMRIFL